MAFAFNGSNQAFQVDIPGGGLARPFVFGALFNTDGGGGPVMAGIYDTGGGGQRIQMHQTAANKLLLIDASGNSPATTETVADGTWCAALTEVFASGASRFWLYDRDDGVWESEDGAGDPGSYGAVDALICGARNESGTPDLYTSVKNQHVFLLRGFISDTERLRFGNGESPLNIWPRERFVIYRSLYRLNDPDDIGPPLRSVGSSFPTLAGDAARTIRPYQPRRWKLAVPAAPGGGIIPNLAASGGLAGEGGLAGIGGGLAA